jgi:hypothetical protein
MAILENKTCIVPVWLRKRMNGQSIFISFGRIDICILDARRKRKVAEQTKKGHHFGE